jgi:hypothetical protein
MPVSSRRIPPARQQTKRFTLRIFSINTGIELKSDYLPLPFQVPDYNHGDRMIIPSTGDYA